MSEERWEEAVKHARTMLEIYKEIPTGIFGATLIAKAITRYEDGEKTNELLEELESFE